MLARSSLTSPVRSPNELGRLINLGSVRESVGLGAETVKRRGVRIFTYSFAGAEFRESGPDLQCWVAILQDSYNQDRGSQVPEGMVVWTTALSLDHSQQYGGSSTLIDLEHRKAVATRRRAYLPSRLCSALPHFPVSASRRFPMYVHLFGVAEAKNK